jgi:Trypsin
MVQDYKKTLIRQRAAQMIFSAQFLMKRMLIGLMVICAVAHLVRAADLAGPNALLPAALEQQKRVAKAADAFAGALYSDKGTEYIVTLKGALNAASNLSLTSSPIWAPTRAAYTANLFDRDPRYIDNVKTLVLEGTQTSGRVWGGLPTSGYLNTVVISGGSGLCSGTAIARNAVLTAQHCHCDGVNQFVAVGPAFDGLHPGIPIRKSTPMKKCDQPVSAEADVALLILRDDLDVSVTPAIFASTVLIDSAQSVRVVGFGRDSSGNAGQKLFVDVPLASSSCSGAVRKSDGTSVPDSVYYGCNKGFELVAGAALLNKDTCNGDSGGPAFVRDNAGNDYLAAATSRAVTYPGARPCGDGGVYVRVDKDVMAWISKQGVKVAVAP